MDGIKGFGSKGIGLLGDGVATSQSVLDGQKDKLPETKDPVKASEQFEALLLQDLMKSMWKTVPKGELVSGSDEEATYRDMLNEALAKSISEGRGIGVKDIILKDINNIDKKI